MSCLDTDTLATLVALLGDDPPADLHHLTTCRDCARRVHRLAVVRAALRRPELPAEGFVERVMAGLPTEARQARPDRLGRWLVALNPLLAGSAAFFALLLASSQPSAGLPPAWALAGAGLVAAASARWWRRAGQPERTP